MTIEFEASPPILDVQPELVQATGEVTSLGVEDGEPVAIALVVRGCGVGATGFLLGVEALEREDGEAVDHHAGRLGMQRRGLVLRRNAGEQEQVDLLGEVVAALVEVVDDVLVLGDVMVGGDGVADGVLVVPEVEVGAVLGEDEGGEWIGGNGGGPIGVPASGGLVMEMGEGVCVEHAIQSTNGAAAGFLEGLVTSRRIPLCCLNSIPC